ncbi:MAG: hypothetical protein O4861_13200 [Trichodesmium sp. St16_bin4-tuft]|nr:hypothetical protein [Trichodesmium sp. MAG_R01]MDE5079504.1 hypothetical protein [Trichodesmium sp. St2_bin6]MDE5091540.1 hypothetical protein [Trichodesmium sp. St18_bin3_1_1]MDE5099231.1 hypothetical protein [Trichodesmium sp. St16_bin4-tuft]MDE5104108.1 hypothetical protein [Trichodesmium sp. St19_bin2]
MIKKLEEWESINFQIFELPIYSTKQNLIEIFGKFIECEWIEFDAYENRESLLNYLKKVLDNFERKYVISFL